VYSEETVLAGQRGQGNRGVSEGERESFSQERWHPPAPNQSEHTERTALGLWGWGAGDRERRDEGQRNDEETEKASYYVSSKNGEGKQTTSMVLGPRISVSLLSNAETGRTSAGGATGKTKGHQVGRAGNSESGRRKHG